MQRSQGRIQGASRRLARQSAVPLATCTAIAVAACHVPHASAAAPNVFVNTSGGVQEYTLAGVAVGAPHFLPAAPGGDGGPRDLVVDPAGRLHVFNGTFDPFLSTRPAGGGAFTHRTHAGWSSVNNTGYGGVCASGDYVFVSDMLTFGSPDSQLNGVVRFDLANNTATRFADGVDSIDVSLGLDGLLYVVYPGGSPEGNTINVYDPNTLAYIRTISLGHLNSQRAVAVAANGHIYAANWGGSLSHWSPTGQQLQFVPTGYSSLTDIDIWPDGTVVATAAAGRVLVTDLTLSTIGGFNTPGGTAFVSFTQFVPEPASAGVAATMLLLTATARRRRRT